MKGLTSLTSIAFLMGFVVPASALDLNLNLGGDLGATLGIAGSSDDEESSGGLALGLDGGLGIGLNANGGANGGGGAVIVNGNADAAATLFANANAAARVEAVINLIVNSNWATGDLAGYAAIDAAFDVTAWLEAETTADFNAAVTANAGEINDLQAAIAANAAMTAWLQTNNIDLQSVVALGMTAEGTLVAFTD
jgi:hypothetical protein